MRSVSRWALALFVAVAAAGSASAQIYPGGGGGLNTGKTDDTNKLKFAIKRRTASGMVKSLDNDRHTLILASGQKEIPVDVGPSVIKAGKGGAKFEDIKVGDKISVYGESTVQGGLRSMEMRLPKERMSIPPFHQKPLTKEEKAALKEAQKEAHEKEKAAKAEAEAAKKAKKDKEKARREAEKAAEKSDKSDKSDKSKDKSDKDKAKDDKTESDSK
jgi:hypothetical protein